jgi:membrane protein insertase Oxa1/YidC/SpoIIIJ
MEIAIIILAFIFMLYQYFTIKNLRQEIQQRIINKKLLEEKVEIYYSRWREAVDSLTKNKSI